MTSQRPVAAEHKHNRFGTMSIDWFIGKRCNYSCSYCGELIHDNYSAHVPFDKMKIFVDKIVERYGTNISWTLVGGEPTINPDFFKLLEYLQDKKYEIAIGTNGSRPLAYLIRMFELSDHVTFSLHFEHITPDLDTEINKVIELEKWRVEYNSKLPLGSCGPELNQVRKKSLIARVMARPGFGTEIEKTTAALKAAGVAKIENRVIRPQSNQFVSDNKIQLDTGEWVWKIKPVKKDIDSTTKVAPDKSNVFNVDEIMDREDRWYSDDEREMMKKLYESASGERKWLTLYLENEDGSIVEEQHDHNQMNYEYKTNFTGWTCNAGITCLKIAPNGDIFVANCFQGGAIANIYTMDDSVVMPTKPVICEKFRCTDPFDLKQAKYLNDTYKHLVIHKK